VHALIFGFLQEGVDPAVVALHAAEAVEVPDHAGHHSWDAYQVGWRGRRRGREGGRRGSKCCMSI
jgi:hypothetical protein